MYIDGHEDFHDSEFTIFGKVIHSILEEHIKAVETPLDLQVFDKKFFEALSELKAQSYHFDKDLVSAMRSQGKRILEDFGPYIKLKFPSYEVLGTEELLYEKIPETDWFFKGFIDLILKIDDKILMIDWKTTSWGWDAKKRGDKMINYQLALYKSFYCQKHDVDPKSIKTYFGLLKRTANKDNVEIFEASSGLTRISHARQAISEMLSMIESGRSFKNRLSCDRCNFRNSEFCKRS